MMGFKEIIQQRRLEEVANVNELQDIQHGEENLEELAGTYKFFGIENANHFPTSVVLWHNGANAEAIQYSQIMNLSYDASEGITFRTNNLRVTITGRNLVKLFNYLAYHKAKYITANVGNDLTEEAELFVKEIIIEEA